MQRPPVDGTKSNWQDGVRARDLTPAENHATSKLNSYAPKKVYWGNSSNIENKLRGHEPLTPAKISPWGQTTGSKQQEPTTTTTKKDKKAPFPPFGRLYVFLRSKKKKKNKVFLCPHGLKEISKWIILFHVSESLAVICQGNRQKKVPYPWALHRNEVLHLFTLNVNFIKFQFFVILQSSCKYYTL